MRAGYLVKEAGRRQKRKRLQNKDSFSYPHLTKASLIRNK
jgi:hypothetical protein